MLEKEGDRGKGSNIKPSAGKREAVFTYWSVKTSDAGKRRN